MAGVRGVYYLKDNKSISQLREDRTIEVIRYGDGIPHEYYECFATLRCPSDKVIYTGKCQKCGKRGDIIKAFVLINGTYKFHCWNCERTSGNKYIPIMTISYENTMDDDNRIKEKKIIDLLKGNVHWIVKPYVSENSGVQWDELIWYVSIY